MSQVSSIHKSDIAQNTNQRVAYHLRDALCWTDPLLPGSSKSDHQHPTEVWSLLRQVSNLATQYGLRRRFTLDINGSLGHLELVSWLPSPNNGTTIPNWPKITCKETLEVFICSFSAFIWFVYLLAICALMSTEYISDDQMYTVYTCMMRLRP